MKRTYTCAICGKEYDSLDCYLKCVTACGNKLKEKEKEKAEKKRIEEINAELNRVKEAKKYYEDKLNQFKEKYPEEYELNFGNINKKKVILNKNKYKNKECAVKEKPESLSVLYKKSNDEEPVIKAKVNGKDVKVDELFKDSDVRYLAELLGIL